ncbi:hypothetical protein Tco_0173818 [Tanacetum coccineum]
MAGGAPPPSTGFFAGNENADPADMGAAEQHQNIARREWDELRSSREWRSVENHFARCDRKIDAIFEKARSMYRDGHLALDIEDESDIKRGLDAYFSDLHDFPSNGHRFRRLKLVAGNATNQQEMPLEVIVRKEYDKSRLKWQGLTLHSIDREIKVNDDRKDDIQVLTLKGYRSRLRSEKGKEEEKRGTRSKSLIPASLLDRSHSLYSLLFRLRLREEALREQGASLPLSERPIEREAVNQLSGLGLLVSEGCFGKAYEQLSFDGRSIAGREELIPS